MSVSIVSTQQQAKGAFDGGRIEENKPVGFPHEPGGIKSFSTLFYWAHAWSKPGGEIGLHPHKGFEIMSYVLEGEIEHYDTLQRKWIPLEQGGLQMIRSGNGVSHAERIKKDSAIFQIWFDPNLEKALGKPASYSDHKEEEFPIREENGHRIIDFNGAGSPLVMESDARMQRIFFKGEALNLRAEPGRSLAIHVTEGKLSRGDEVWSKGDFVKVEDEAELSLKISEEGNLFLISVPKVPAYHTYISRTY